MKATIFFNLILFFKEIHIIIFYNNYYLSHIRHQIVNEYDCVIDRPIPL